MFTVQIKNVFTAPFKGLPKNKLFQKNRNFIVITGISR